MNKVIMPEQEEAPKNMTVGELMKVSEWGLKHTAFVGQCGTGPRWSLYLIACNHVILASRPKTMWGVDGMATPVTVDRFVDIEIRVLP